MRSNSVLRKKLWRSRVERVQSKNWSTNIHERRTADIWQICMSVGFAIFFCPASYAVPNGVFTLWQGAVIAVAAVSVLLVLARNKLTLRWFVLVLGCGSYYFLSSAFGRGDAGLINSLYNASRLVGFASLMEYGLERDQQSTIICFLIAGIGMCCVNYVVFLRYCNVVGGMRHGYIEYGARTETNQNWYFFSHDNGTVFYYLPTLAIMWFYAFRYSRKATKAAVVLTAVTAAMYFYLWSATAMVMTGVFLIAMVVCLSGRTAKLMSKLSYRTVVLVGFIFSAAVIYLNVSGSFNTLAALFDKNGTAYARSLIWQRSIDWFLRNPLLGVGYESDIAGFMRIGINHCHNVLIQLMYTGGIITFALFAIFVLLCRPKGLLPEYALPLTVCIGLLFLGWTFDFYLYMPVAVCPFLVLARCGLRESKQREVDD